MAQINKPTDYFNTVTYTGSTSQQSITGVGFQPDLCWFKNRATASRHQLYDAVRGATKLINSDSSDAEQTVSYFSSFDSDGYTIPSGSSALNGSGQSIVSWNWLGANASSSNTDGSITSSVSASTTSGFSVVTYTGNGTGGATIGHGLGSTPSAIFVKRLDDLGDWGVYHSALGNTNYLRLNTTGASASDSTYWNNTSPTSSVFTVGTITNVNGSGSTHVAYCFSEKKGYSKFSSYVGNGSSTSPPFIYTGFKPAFVIAKRTTIEFWVMSDNKRDGYNPNKNLYPNATNAEDSNQQFNFYSNGFAPNSNQGSNNSSGETYIYMAFAAEPLVSTAGIPCTAR
jgi:hypothetical protein